MSNDGYLIKTRFFTAIDLLKDSGRMPRGLMEFSEKHEVNRSWLSRVRNDSDKSPLRAEVVKWLCEDYGVSADYILFGKGRILKPQAPANK